MSERFGSKEELIKFITAVLFRYKYLFLRKKAVTHFLILKSNQKAWQIIMTGFSPVPDKALLHLDAFHSKFFPLCPESDSESCLILFQGDGTARRCEPGAGRRVHLHAERASSSDAASAGLYVIVSLSHKQMHITRLTLAGDVHPATAFWNRTDPCFEVS